MLNIEILLVGPLASGKTSIIHRKLNHFQEDYKSTTSEFAIFSHQSKEIDVEQRITEIGGQCIGPFHDIKYKEKDAIIITIDSTDPTSITLAEKYIQKASNLTPDANIYLVATKSDMDSAYSDLTSKLDNLVTKYHLNSHFTCSAKENIGIDDLFITIAEDYIQENLIHYKIEEFKQTPGNFIKLLTDNIEQNDANLRDILQEKCFDIALLALLEETDKSFSIETLNQVGKQYKDEIKNALFGYINGIPDREALSLLENEPTSSTKLGMIFRVPRGVFGVFSKTSESRGVLLEIKGKATEIRNRIDKYKEDNIVP